MHYDGVSLVTRTKIEWRTPDNYDILQCEWGKGKEGKASILIKKLYLNDELRYEAPINDVIHFELVKDFPPKEEPEYDAPFLHYPDSAAWIEFKNVQKEDLLKLIQGRWSVFLECGGVVGCQEVAPDKMEFEFIGTDSLIVHNAASLVGSRARKIERWKRTAYGYLLFLKAENDTEELPFYFIQHLRHKDSLHIAHTVTPVHTYPVFSYSMTRLE
jgi:hypothetical protein